MQIVMFDRQSIFIHGMKISLSQRIPCISIRGVSQADELWQKLTENPEALMMLDGDLEIEFCYWLLEKTVQQFPQLKVLVTASDCGKKARLNSLSSMCWRSCHETRCRNICVGA